MFRNHKPISAGGIVISIIVLLNVLILQSAYLNNKNNYLMLAGSVPLLLLAVYYMKQKKKALKGSIPDSGYFRHFFNTKRKKLIRFFIKQTKDEQVFFLSNKPVLYQQGKNSVRINSSGIQSLFYGLDAQCPAQGKLTANNYQRNFRVIIGNEQCSQPYHSSILNMGSMDFNTWDTTTTTIESLNEAAQTGGFAQNTGTNGISPSHFKGGDLVWHIDADYKGCKSDNGKFNNELFSKNAKRPEVKMIEIKLLPGDISELHPYPKLSPNTIEKISDRNKDSKTAFFPRKHSAFFNAEGFLMFLSLLRQLSGGKPVGFKISISNTKEFYEICYSVFKTGIIPDFITVYSNESETDFHANSKSQGMSLYDALCFVSGALKLYGLNKKIKIIAEEKISSGFEIIKVMALGADLCYSPFDNAFEIKKNTLTATGKDKSPAMPGWFAKGNRNNETGISPAGFCNFHRNMIRETEDLMETCGFNNPASITVPGIFNLLDTLSPKYQKEITWKNLKKANKKQQTLLN